jgi:2-polyprenyl-3-methyl-5-hydroxy-6-metoxy-1,4-benzoquinol methylase
MSAGNRAAAGSPIFCAIGGEPSAHYAVARDRFFAAVPGEFLLARCRACRCIFRHPLPPEAELAGYYPESYWWSEKSSASGRLLKSLERIYRETVTLDHVRFLEKCARGADARRRTLLDIGCGSGTFLCLAQRRGFDAHGMDVSSHAVRIVREEHGLPARQGGIGDDVWPGESFDYVTMFHVLEHVVDPRKALRYARGLLRPGGSLVIQVPNVDSLQARLFAARWYGLDVPRHVINYSPEALGLLLEEADFRICRRARFSLRDNPAALASSLIPALDPLGRKARVRRSRHVAEVLAEAAYLGLVLLCLPLAALEGLLGCSGTIWVEARLR